jgi:chaperonin GroEL
MAHKQICLRFGAFAIDLKRGLNRAARRTIEVLPAMSRPIKTRKKKAM